MSEEDGLCHDVLGQELGAGLDHHDRVAGTRDDQVELGVGQLAVRRVDDELATNAADPHRADWARKRDLADREGRGGGDGAEDVGLVLLVRGEDGDHELDVVLVALGEEGPDRAIGQARREGRRLRGPGLALDEAARDLARGVHPLFEFNGEREEVEPGAGVAPVGGAEDHRVAVANGDGAAGQAGQLAGFDGQRSTAELGLEGCGHGVVIPPGRGGG